jgi:hypothetical protein
MTKESQPVTKKKKKKKKKGRRTEARDLLGTDLRVIKAQALKDNVELGLVNAAALVMVQLIKQLGGLHRQRLAARFSWRTLLVTVAPSRIVCGRLGGHKAQHLGALRKVGQRDLAVPITVQLCHQLKKKKRKKN